MKTLLKFAFHPDPWLRIIISLTYILAGVFLNFYALQVFCIPVWWAALFAGSYFGALIFFPVLKHPVLGNAGYFLAGAGIPVSVYCLVFLYFPVAYLFYLLAILFLGAGLLAFFPFYLLYHTGQYYKTGTLYQKKLLLSGCALSVLGFAIYFLACLSTYTQLEKNLSGAKTFSPEVAARLPANHLTERVLGVGFKYHTSLDFWEDGWRPPLHDPAFNLFIRLRAGSTYPFPQLSLSVRIQYYKKLFPKNRLKWPAPALLKAMPKRIFRQIFMNSTLGINDLLQLLKQGYTQKTNLQTS